MGLGWCSSDDEEGHRYCGSVMRGDLRSNCCSLVVDEADVGVGYPVLFVEGVSTFVFRGRGAAATFVSWLLVVISPSLSSACTEAANLSGRMLSFRCRAFW